MSIGQVEIPADALSYLYPSVLFGYHKAPSPINLNFNTTDWQFTGVIGGPDYVKSWTRMESHLEAYVFGALASGGLTDAIPL